METQAVEMAQGVHVVAPAAVFHDEILSDGTPSKKIDLIGCVTTSRDPIFLSLPEKFPEKLQWYTVHRIPKRSGGIRIIEAPAEWLKKVQRGIYEKILLPCCPVSKKAFGCIKRRGITPCAAPHVGSRTVMKIDLKDFFHKIDTKMIEEALSKANLPAETINKILYYCTNSKGVLPQGAPTSPSLANIVVMRMYAALDKLAVNNGVQFTGYLDDLIFSGEKANKILYPALEVISRYGFIVSKKKIVFMRRKREVLGICVAPGKEHSRLPKHRRNLIRAYIHCLERDFEKNGSVDMEFFHKTAGLVSFALQARDQKAAGFQERIQALRQKMKERS